MDSAENCVVLCIEKICVSGLVQFKFVLFKGQLYSWLCSIPSLPPYSPSEKHNSSLQLTPDLKVCPMKLAGTEKWHHLDI